MKIINSIHQGVLTEEEMKFINKDICPKCRMAPLVGVYGSDKTKNGKIIKIEGKRCPECCIVFLLKEKKDEDK